MINRDINSQNSLEKKIAISTNKNKIKKQLTLIKEVLYPIVCGQEEVYTGVYKDCYDTFKDTR